MSEAKENIVKLQTLNLCEFDYANTQTFVNC